MFEYSVVTLDDKDYFCDPIFELSHDNGNGYIYFGMNYADRTRDGIGNQFFCNTFVTLIRIEYVID